MTVEKFSPELEAALKKREEAEKIWHTNGRLGVTGDDHWAIGGTPTLELNKNPGKTEGELWSIEKIKETLDGWVDFLEKARKRLPDVKTDFVANMNTEDDIKWAKKELRLAMPYLKSINKLPPEYENFSVEDLPGDPK